jgi:hypothetical protein
MTADDARVLLHRKMDMLDIETAREDVSRFIPVPADLDLWSREYFHQIAETVQGV